MRLLENEHLGAAEHATAWWTYDKVSPRSPQPCGRMLIFMTTTSKLSSAQLRVDDLAGVRGTIITAEDPRYDAA
jgi:hypothetical protein